MERQCGTRNTERYTTFQSVFACFRVFILFQAERGYTKPLFSHEEAFFMRVCGSVCCFYFPCRSDVVPLNCRGGGVENAAAHLIFGKNTCIQFPPLKMLSLPFTGVSVLPVFPRARGRQISRPWPNGLGW